MSAAVGRPYVRIKLATSNDEWAKVYISPGMEVADVAGLACSSLAWGLTPNRFRLFMVAKAGEPRPQLPAPEAFRDLVPLAGEATLESAGVTSGAWLVAVPLVPAGSGGGGGVGESASPPTASADLATIIARGFEGLQLQSSQQHLATKEQLSAALRQVVTEDFPFSATSPSAVHKLLTARGLSVRDNVPLPPIAHLMPPAASLAPFDWPAGMKETTAAPALLQLLTRWVKSDYLPVLEQDFMDVQDLAAHSPLVISEPGVGTFKGVPGMAILRHYISASGVISPLSNCAAAVDWKTPLALKEGVKQQGALQVLALSEYNANGAPPLFFTDLKTHFWCYMKSGGFVCCFRGAGGTNNLSLAEGVGLIRHFLLLDTQNKYSRLQTAVVPTSEKEAGWVSWGCCAEE